MFYQYFSYLRENKDKFHFDEFGKEPDGSKDIKKNKELQDIFFLKV